YAVATNRCPAGAYRGVGMALGTFVRERVVDMVARRAGLDPIDVRRRNFVDVSELPFQTASGLIVDSGDPKQSLERALASSDYTRRRSESRHAPAGKYLGVGVASYTEFTGMGSGTFRLRGMRQVAGPDLTIEAGTIAVRGAPGRAVTIAEVADLAHRPSGGTLPPGVDPGLEATQYYDPPPATFSNGTHVAVVEVDPETGQVAIVRH